MKKSILYSNILYVTSLLLLASLSQNVLADIPDRFELLDGGLVRDLTTDLVWQRCPAGQQLDNGQCSGSPVELKWNDISGYITENNNFLGWRLPTVWELSTIIDHSSYAPSIDSEIFPGTPSIEFWSNQKSVVDNDEKWVIDFKSGSVATTSARNNRPFRLIRTTAPVNKLLSGDIARFINNRDGTVTDLRTGLMWQQCHYNKDPKSNGCKDKPETEIWSMAITLSSRLADFDDWRLPSAVELLSLVDYDRTSPAVDDKLFLNTENYYYWTSTTSANNSVTPLSVNFTSGFTRELYREQMLYIRLVRGSITTKMLPEIEPIEIDIDQLETSQDNPPLGIALAATVSGGEPPYQYRWIYNKKTVGEENQLNYFFESSGKKSVTLEVEDKYKQLASTSIDLTITDKPPPIEKPVITASVLKGIAPLKASLSTNIKENENYVFKWDFGDGIKMEGITIAEHTWNEPGQYVIKLDILHNGEIKGNTAITIDVLDQSATPEAKFSSAISMENNSYQIELDGTDSIDKDGEITAHEWSISNGFSAEGPTVTVAADQPGSYIITLTVTDNDGLSSTAKKEITIEQGVSTNREEVTPGITDHEDNMDGGSIPANDTSGANSWIRIVNDDSQQELNIGDMIRFNLEIKSNISIDIYAAIILSDGNFLTFTPPPIQFSLLNQAIPFLTNISLSDNELLTLLSIKIANDTPTGVYQLCAVAVLAGYNPLDHRWAGHDCRPFTIGLSQE